MSSNALKTHFTAVNAPRHVIVIRFGRSFAYVKAGVMRKLSVPTVTPDRWYL